MGFFCLSGHKKNSTVTVQSDEESSSKDRSDIGQKPWHQHSSVTGGGHHPAAKPCRGWILLRQLQIHCYLGRLLNHMVVCCAFPSSKRLPLGLQLPPVVRLWTKTKVTKVSFFLVYREHFLWESKQNSQRWAKGQPVQSVPLQAASARGERTRPAGSHTLF